MSTRLQIVMKEEEIQELRRAAEKEGLSLSEWARMALRKARRHTKGPSPAQKIAALDRALTRGHPTADIEKMLAEIEAGRDLR